MIYDWELRVLSKWSTNKIKNAIELNRSCGQPTESSVSIDAMRYELKKRGEEPTGYHNT